MMEQLELFAAYAVRTWVVVPACDRAKIAVGPCSYEIAFEHVQAWAAEQQAQRAAGRWVDRPGATSYHLRAATPAEIADSRAWETVMRYDRDQMLARIAA
jgi:hypothetical protein